MLISVKSELNFDHHFVIVKTDKRDLTVDIPHGQLDDGFKLKIAIQYGLAVLNGRTDLTVGEIVRTELDKDFKQFTKETK